MKILNAVFLSVLVMAVASCGAVASKATETLTPSATSLPTSTNTPEPSLTPTLEPTETAEPTFTPTTAPRATRIPPTEPILPMPVGTPVSIWEGFPIMPTAISGEGDSSGYSYTVMASAAEVQEYYETELGRLGWNLFATGKGDKGALILMFMKSTSLVTISIIPQDDGLMYVMLVK